MNKETDTHPPINPFPKISFKTLVIGLSIILLASSLRAPLTSVGPVIAEIDKELNLTNTLIGLITAFPLLAFGLLSIFVPRLSSKFGLANCLLFSLFILAVGSVIRSTGNTFLLFFGAALIGGAITIGNVLMPAYIKNQFPKHVGLVTGIYLISMNLTAALAAGFSIQIGQLSGLGWKGSIGIWGILAFITFFIWLPQFKRTSVTSPRDEDHLSKKSLLKSRLAWQVSLFMGLQAYLFYSLAAWLPAVLQSWGMSATLSGWMLSFMQFAMLPLALIGPIAAGRMKDQRILVWLVFVLLALGFSGMAFGKTGYIVISVILLGVAVGFAFTLATMFLVLRTKNTSDAASLSGMSQSIGYLLAATGPPLFGVLYEWTGNWNASIGLLVLASIAILLVGLSSAKNRFVS